MKENFWRINRQGKREFLNGQQDWQAAVAAAAGCATFLGDVEEEWVTEEPRSCYNCRYRRWTEEAFTCLALNAV